MPPRRAHYSTRDQTVIDFDAPAPEPVEPVANDVVAERSAAERSAPEYSVATGWIDTAGKTRTWLLRDPHGTQLAEITTKRDARKLADLLNRVMGDQCSPLR